MIAHDVGDLVAEPETRQEGYPQTFKVVSLQEKRANEWRKNWYWPAVLHGLTKPQADLFSAAPELVAALERLLASPHISKAAFLAHHVEVARAALAKARGGT